MMLAKIVILLIFPIFGLCSEVQDITNMLRKVITKVQDEYPYTIDSQAILSASVSGIMNILDNNSQYFTEEEFGKRRANTKGNYKGAGLEISKEKNGNIFVKSVLESSPSAKAGITAGDVIISINEKRNLSVLEAVNLISNSKKVIIEIMREGKIFIHSIFTDNVEINNIESRIIENKILYLHVSYFAQNTDLFIKEKIENNKCEGIILDLCNNLGGVFNQALSIAEMFLEKNKVLAITKDRKKKHVYKSNGGQYTKIPLVVIINKNTASAAEVVTGALQDNKRAKIIGENSFGKGSIQSIVPLKEGYGAIKFTTAIYYTPNNNEIDELGITPDIIANNDQITKAIDLLSNYR